VITSVQPCIATPHTSIPLFEGCFLSNNDYPDKLWPAMFQGGQWILAMAVLHEMMLIRLPPSNATFSAAISACTSEETLMVISWDAKHLPCRLPA